MSLSQPRSDAKCLHSYHDRSLILLIGIFVGRCWCSTKLSFQVIIFLAWRHRNMAGMLPGVESARRRRIHGGTRRSPLCLYTSSHEKHHTYTTPSLQRSVFDQAYKDEELGGAAREAKERLDERLRGNRNSETKRSNTKDCSRYVEGSSMVLGKSHTEALSSKQSGSERFSWVKLSWIPSASDQENNAFCL